MNRERGRLPGATDTLLADSEHRDATAQTQMYDKLFDWYSPMLVQLDQAFRPKSLTESTKKKRVSDKPSKDGYLALTKADATHISRISYEWILQLVRARNSSTPDADPGPHPFDGDYVYIAHMALGTKYKVSLLAPTLRSNPRMAEKIVAAVVKRYDHRAILKQAMSFIPAVVEARQWIMDVWKYEPYRLYKMQFRDGLGASVPSALPQGLTMDPRYPPPSSSDFTLQSSAFIKVYELLAATDGFYRVNPASPWQLSSTPDPDILNLLEEAGEVGSTLAVIS